MDADCIHLFYTDVVAISAGLCGRVGVWANLQINVFVLPHGWVVQLCSVWSASPLQWDIRLLFLFSF